MRVDITNRETITIVTVHGSVGMSEAEGLRQELACVESARPQAIVLDLARMTFICSTGLGALIAAHATAAARKARLRLAAPQPDVMQVLETTRLTRLFDVCPSVEDAVGK